MLIRLFREVGVSNGSLNERLVPADSQSRRDCVLQPRVASNELPWEIEIAAALFFEPKVGDPFELFHPFRLSNRAPKVPEHMNVIFYPAHLQRRAVELFGHRAKVRVQGLPNGLIT